MADLDEIKLALADHDNPRFVRAMALSAKAATPGLADLALGYLGDDRSLVRNTAALALRELGDPRTPAAIRESLVRPGVAPQSGTLVYVLRELGDPVTPAEAAIIVEHGSFEARGEIVEMLAAGLLDMSADLDWQPIMDRLAGLTEMDDGIGWAAEALLERMGQTTADPSASQA